jgi:hypothetical protein
MVWKQIHISEMSYTSSYEYYTDGDDEIAHKMSVSTEWKSGKFVFHEKFMTDKIILSYIMIKIPHTRYFYCVLQVVWFGQGIGYYTLYCWFLW